MADGTATDTSGTLDPHRPWIDNPAELPANMNWFSTLLNPFGRTPKLHFTRAWTLLFMSRAILLALLFFVPLILQLAGGKPGGLYALLGAALGITVVITELTSFILHNRRLADAGKSGFWAMLVLAPAILAFGAIAALVPLTVKEHTAMIERIEAAREAGTEGQRAGGNAGNSRRAIRSAGGSQRGGRRGGRGGGGPGGPDAGPPSQQQFVMSRVVPVAGATWAIGSFFVMLWSLLWLARRPSREEAE